MPRLLALLSLILCPRQSLAQANYEGVMLGGRTAMMGGAAVARGSDGAVAFLNPAGITRIPGESFTFGTVAVQVALRSVRGPLDPTGTVGVREVDGHEFLGRILPNTFCLFLDGPLKNEYSGTSRHKYGVCAADSEKEDFLLSENPSTVQSSGLISTTSLMSRLMFARRSVAFAWGFEAQQGTSIGVTARIDNSRFEDQTSLSAVFNDGAGVGLRTLDQSRASSSWDSAIVVGITQTVSPFLTLGASLTTPSQHFLGFHDGSESVSPQNGREKTLVQDVGDFRYNQPATLRLGLAFTWPRLHLEINGNYYGAQDVLAQANFTRLSTAVDASGLLEQSSRRQSITEQSKPVVNLALGVEGFLEPDFSIVAGVQTDFSGLEERQISRPADTLFRQRKDTIHAALGVATYGNQGSFLAGVRAYYAHGEFLFAPPTESVPRFIPLSQSEFGLAFVVSGQISIEAMRDAALRAAAPLKSLPGALDKEKDVEPAAEKTSARELGRFAW